jgi:hypothetical protein
MTPDQVGGIASTEVCDLSCVMCHFNGPLARRKSATITPEEGLAFMRSIPKGLLWFAATGEFFMDPNALVHLRNAAALGHQPAILTNGQSLTPELIDELLRIGVRLIRFSVDAYDPETYRKIRRGGELSKIVDACRYLRARRRDYPKLRVEVNNVLFHKTFPDQERFIAFWTGLVDAVNFNAEYYDSFRFRNTFIDPGERVDCHLQLYLLPTGHMSPCCAVHVYQHTHNIDWLPHIRDTEPAAALDAFQKMYDDPASPLANLCRGCEWWILWKRDEAGNSPYFKTVEIDDGAGGWPRADELAESAGYLELSRLSLCNDASRNGTGLTTPASQWWYAALLTLPPGAADAEPLFIRLEAGVEEGAIGIALVEADGSPFTGPEVVRQAASQPVTFHLTAHAGSSARSMVIRNVSPAGRSTVRLQALHAYRLKRAPDPNLVSIQAGR